MADNSLQTGADSIRDIDRSGTGPKTQVMQLDHGGSGASESLTSPTNPLPIKAVDPTQLELLARILTELQVVSTLLQVGLSTKDDPADLRADYSVSI